MCNRIEDPTVLRWVTQERDGVCMYGLFKRDGCSNGLDAHHIKTKGSGGDDTKENLITLCRRHHHQAQVRMIRAGELRRILKQWFGYQYTQEELDE